MTKEFKNRYRALYFGQNVGKTRQNVEKLYKVDTLYMATFQNTGWLQLRSLESITDEEAVEVARMLGFTTFGEGMSVIDYGEYYGVTCKENDWPNERKALKIYKDAQEIYEVDAEGNIIQYSLWHLMHVIDHLRKKGFALPYDGVSVDEMVKEGFVGLHPLAHPSKATKISVK